jgi:hypothetical protein
MPVTIAITPLKTLLKFPFQGPDWRNRFLVGSAITLAAFVVPILPLVFVYGYVLHIMRRAIEGQDLELPAWDDWGKLGVDGLRLMLVGLVYLLPGILVLFGGWFLYMASSFVFPVLMSGAGHRGSEGLAAFAFLAIFGSLMIMVLAMIVGLVLMLLGLIPLPAAVAHFAAQDKVAAALHVREWWPLLRANKLGYFAAWVVTVGLMTVMNYVLVLVYYSIILCCLVPLLAAPISFYVLLISSALFGQVYRESKAALAAKELAPAG